MASHYQICITGIIQGVGFRPFIWSLARQYNVTGTVYNNSDGVVIDCSCTAAQLSDLVQAIKNNGPPAAVIGDVTVHTRPEPVFFPDFTISPSLRHYSASIYISPDLALCATCYTEMFDPDHRRYLHPFINCTACGPRYSIIKDTPYDRAVTSMASFALCKACEDEYLDPADRRFHAEPISCLGCGPRCSITSLPDDRLYHFADCLTLVRNGKIACIKGIGGYQISCDAANGAAVERVRQFKNRPDKPFAIMARSLTDIHALCHVSREEEASLLSPAGPIVLLRLQDPALVSAAISRGNKRIGVMLPTTPLHHLFFHYCALPFLLMTSGNRGGEPLITSRKKMVENLGPLVDFCIDHDRDIHNPIDDSVVMVQSRQVRVIRRGRGYAPTPIPLNVQVHGILALGGQQKNTFAIGRGCEAFVSHHIGTLGYLETNEFLHESIAAYRALFQLDYDYVVHDLHPDYVTTQIASSLGIKHIGVQHHHAHHASCMAEHQLTEQCIGIILDGSGYGDDGTIWGGEIIVADMVEYDRVCHFETVAMVGGEKAVKQPFRMAMAYLHHFLDEEELRTLYGEHDDFNLIHGLLQNDKSVMTSSCGRLFDTVAFLLGLIDRISFEGQAAILVEQCAEESSSEEVYGRVLQVGIDRVIPTVSLVREVFRDWQQGRKPAQICRIFLNTLSRLLVSAVVKIGGATSLSKVVLSGGVFQNSILTADCQTLLSQAGFTCYTHSKVPCNDGGIALGQLCIGAMQRGLIE
ncbi:MAG: carbamoyltransferase HypF [Desulfobulbaceae bacterium]|nr:carbamoyltransferase HypF [Desulfobulbaceae bacterium]